MSDESDFDRAERILGHEIKASEMLARLLNPELLFSKPKTSRVIDLRRTYDIQVNQLPTLFRMEAYEALDRVTFDPDPESRWHIVGRGTTTTEAVSDLLERIAAEIAKGDA